MENVPRYYANWVTPRLGPYDLSLDFGYTRNLNPEPDEWVASVVLSWEEAVVLHNLLGRAIADYEEHAGGIREWEELPPLDVDPDSNGSPGEEEED